MSNVFRSVRAFAAACLLLLTALPLHGFASQGPAFQVEPVYPANQREQNGYFDLRVEPGERQDLTLLVTNSDSKDIRVQVEALNASTASDGFIDYTTPGVRDESLGYPFAELATVPEPVVTVPAGGSARVTVSFEAPGEELDGMILGGISVLKLDDGASGGMIVNAYQYALAVALTMNDNPVQPDFELVDVTTGLQNYRAAVTAAIRNPVPLAVKYAEVTAELFPQDGDQAVYTIGKTVDMAPNSLWNCVMVDQAGYGFQAGAYTYRLRIEYGGQVWTFEQPLTITAPQAQAMNDNAVNQQQQQAAGGFPLWGFVLIGVGVLLLLLLALLLVLLLRKKSA